jgi:hypothetical protein
MNEIEWLDKVQKNFEQRNWNAIAGDIVKWRTITNVVINENIGFYKLAETARIRDEISHENYIELVVREYERLVGHGV